MKFPISFYTKFIPTLKNLCLQVKTTERGCEIKALRGSFTALETILEGGGSRFFDRPGHKTLPSQPYCRAHTRVCRCSHSQRTPPLITASSYC